MEHDCESYLKGILSPPSRPAAMFAYAVNLMVSKHPDLLDAYVPAFLNTTTHKLRLLDSPPHEAWSTRRGRILSYRAFGRPRGQEVHYNELILSDYAQGPGLGLSHTLMLGPCTGGTLAFVYRRSEVAWLLQETRWDVADIAWRIVNLVRRPNGVPRAAWEPTLQDWGYMMPPHVQRATVLSRERRNRKECTRCTQTAATILTCGGCRQTFYCSRACQRTDWARHKEECKWLKGKVLVAGRDAQRLL